jgi:uncharacterized membrane protein
VPFEQIVAWVAESSQRAVSRRGKKGGTLVAFVPPTPSKASGRR